MATIETDTEREYLTRNEAAEIARVNYHTIYNWQRQGILSKVKIGGRALVRRSEIEAFLGESE